MSCFVQTNQYKSPLFSNTADIFTLNDNILSEYANYSQYLIQLFVFFCVSVANKVYTTIITFLPGWLLLQTACEL